MNSTTMRSQAGVPNRQAGALRTDRVSPRLTRSEGGKTMYPPLFPRSYRSVCHRCPPGSPGVDPEPLERFATESAARLAPLPGPARLRTGAIAWSASRLIPLPALCRPPTSHWRAGARRCRKAHQRLDQPLRDTLRRRALPCGSCGVLPVRAPYHRCQPRNRVTTARGTPWSITRHQDYLSGEDRIPCPPKTLALAPSP